MPNIIDVTGGIKVVAGQGAVSTPLSLKVGSIVNATAVHDSAGGSVALRIGNQVVNAETNLQINSNSKLNLRVDQFGDQVILKLLNQQGKKGVIADLLRTDIPRQQGMSSLLANLSMIASGANKASASDLAPLMQAILQKFAKSGDLSKPEVLKKAVYNSGIFLESRIMQEVLSGNRENLTGDLKAILLTLVDYLKRKQKKSGSVHSDDDYIIGKLKKSIPTDKGVIPEPPRKKGHPIPQPQTAAILDKAASEDEISALLSKQLESVLSRIRLNQMTTATGGTEKSEKVWNMELPIRNQDSLDIFHLQIKEEKSVKKTANLDGWSAELAFNLDKLGNVYMRARGVGGQMSITLWLEQGDTAKIFQDSIDELRKTLEQYNIGKIICLQGSPGDEQEGQNFSSIINERV